jgi:hypothetical protein
MIVCPVCEHAQAVGSECEVCGKRFGREAVPVPVGRLEALEPTRLDDAAAALAPALLAELEPTGYDAAPELLAPPTEIEPTRTAAVTVDATPLPDLERTQAGLPDDGPTPQAAQVACRYCRTPAAAADRFCGRCGMRLPHVAPAPSAAAAAPRLCSCGTPISGSLCRACGARTPA